MVSLTHGGSICNWASAGPVASEKMFEKLTDGRMTPRAILDINRYLLSLWPNEASFMMKSMIIPEKSVVFTFSHTKA